MGLPASREKGQEAESLLVWTTTPWTLTANAAAAVHPEKTYIKVRQDNEIAVSHQGTRGSVLKGEYEVLGEVPSRANSSALRYSAPFAELTAQEGALSTESSRGTK